jgi:hypothetical protein
MDQQSCDCELELFLHKSLMNWLPPEMERTLEFLQDEDFFKSRKIA